MTRLGAATRAVTRTALFLLIGLLILQALGYGIGFFFDPASGAGEFASPPPEVADELTIALVGLVGAGMLGAALFLGLAAVLVWRTEPAGTWIAMTIGFVYVLSGASAYRAGWGWDAYFYAGTGALLFVLSLADRWLGSPAGSAAGPT